MAWNRHKNVAALNQLMGSQSVGKQTHDLTVTASDSKTTQDGAITAKNLARCRFTSPAKFFIRAVVR